MSQSLSNYPSFYLPWDDLKVTVALPHQYDKWEAITAKLVESLADKSLRRKVAALPIFVVDHLTTRHHWQRAFLILSLIGQAYIWGLDELVLDRLPLNLSVPWSFVAHKLGTRPVITYAAVEFYNYKVLDASKPLSLENLDVQFTFTGTRDEAWFYLISIAMEVAGEPAIHSIQSILLNIRNTPQNTIKVREELINIAKVLVRLKEIFNRMYEGNSPAVFYHKVRPFMTGWENNHCHPHGVYYEGVPDSMNPPIPTNDMTDVTGSYQKYAGGSAGQSPLMHALDIALDIKHYSNSAHVEKSVYIYEMRKYMDSPHREFLEFLETSPSIRDFCRVNGLASEFDACVDGMKSFRDGHIQMVTRYIVIPSGQVDKVRGTGGTDLVPFLKQMRDETTAQKLLQ